MRSTPHPAADQLRSFFQGKLRDHDARSIESHLASCESCLATADEIWISESPFAEGEGADLLPQTEARLLASVLRRLHRTELAERVTAMGSRGFLLVILELLRPALALLAQPNADGRRE